MQTLTRFTRLAGALSVALLLLFGLVACSRDEETPPTETPAPEATSLPAEGDAWERIQASGRMVVGTAADYPPFAYYTSDFQLDGYDIALIRAIADELDVELEIRDMAFDGLGGALQVNQIDAAIAAISATEERRQLIDFSNIYFVSEDAVLAQAGAGITVDEAADLAAFRVGVQAGTVYEEWMERELVETNLMPASNLFVYADLEKAVEDLGNGLIDVFVADLQPLQLAERTGVFEIVARGLNRQLFAIALPQGSSLRAPINDALTNVQNAGLLADLGDRFLNLEPDEIVPLPPADPTPTPGAPPTAVPPPAQCVDAMRFIEDLNLDDQDMTNPPVMSPGQAFTKAWRIQNVGTCSWDSRYLFTYVDGNVPAARMGGLPTPIQGEVVPGATYDVSVDLVAPLIPGVYQGFWSMRGPGGLLFGDRVWVGITVPAAPTPTPLPTATPSASIAFLVDRTTINAGECVTFSWDVRNASSVFFYAQGEPWNLNQVPAQGSQVECPSTTTTYDLRVLKPDNTTEIRSIRIDVLPPPAAAPELVSFTITPDHQITVGQCVDVRWQVRGDVTNIRVTRDATTLWNGAPLNGTSRDCPPAGNVVYAIEATGPGGTSRAQRTLTVTPQATPPPQATATPRPATATPQPPVDQPPVINSFSVAPSSINAGDCVTASWSVGGNVNLVQLRRNGAAVIDNAALSGSANDCLSQPGSYTYRIEAYSATGQLAFQQATVTVGSPPPGSDPLEGTAWVLQTMNGAPLLAGAEITVVFGDTGNLSGSSGCNTYNGAYQVTGASLSVGQLSGTNVFCGTPEGIMDQENTYKSILTSATGFEISGQQLTIRGTRGTLVYINMIGPR